MGPTLGVSGAPCVLGSVASTPTPPGRAGTPGAVGRFSPGAAASSARPRPDLRSLAERLVAVAAGEVDGTPASPLERSGGRIARLGRVGALRVVLPVEHERPELTQTLGDHVDGGRRDDEQAEEAEQAEQDRGAP